jgi:hypothetical protein
MKKLFTILIILISVNAFAAWSPSISINGDGVTLSKGVHADYQIFGGTANNAHYVAGTFNDKGTRAYAGADEINTIKFLKCTNDDCGANAPTAIGSNTSTISGWSDVGD